MNLSESRRVASRFPLERTRQIEINNSFAGTHKAHSKFVMVILSKRHAPGPLRGDTRGSNDTHTRVTSGASHGRGSHSRTARSRVAIEKASISLSLFANFPRDLAVYAIIERGFIACSRRLVSRRAFRPSVRQSVRCVDSSRRYCKSTRSKSPPTRPLY